MNGIDLDWLFDDKYASCEDSELTDDHLVFSYLRAKTDELGIVDLDFIQELHTNAVNHIKNLVENPDSAHDTVVRLLLKLIKSDNETLMAYKVWASLSK